MNSRKYLPIKALHIITGLLIAATLLLLLIFSSQKSVLLFPLVSVMFYRQRKRLQDLFQKIKNPGATTALFILTGWLGALFLEITAGISPFHQAPLANYLIGLGFYLPYFAVWSTLIKRYQFGIFEVFYLSGFSRVVFDTLVTGKLLRLSSLASSPASSFLIFIVQAIVTLVLFGMFTTLPAFFLKSQSGQKYNKPLKQYFVGLTPHFLAIGLFMIWVFALKIIFLN